MVSRIAPVLAIGLVCTAVGLVADHAYAAPASCYLSFMKSPLVDPIVREHTVAVSFDLKGMKPHSPITWSCKRVLGPTGGSGWDATLYGMSDSRGALSCTDDHNRYGLYVYTFRDQGAHKLVVPVDYNAIGSNLPLPQTIYEGQYDDNGRLVVGAAASQSGGTAAEDTSTSQPTNPWPESLLGTWYLMGGPKLVFGPGQLFTIVQGDETVVLRFRSHQGTQYLAGDGDRYCRFEIGRLTKPTMLSIIFLVGDAQVRRSFLGFRNPLPGN